MLYGINEWLRSSITFSRDSKRELIRTSFVFSIKAPKATILASFGFPFSMAISLTGIGRSSMSLRLASLGSIREELNIKSPLGKRRGSYLTKEGRFITIAEWGLSTMGEPISLEEITIVQLAVPPLISTP